MHKLKQINVDEPRLLPVLETKRADDVPSRIRRKAKNKTKSSTGDILKQGLTALPVKVTPGDMAIRKAANHHIFMGFNASNVNLDGNDISLPYSSSSTKSNRININRNYNNINRLNQELNAVELTPSALMYDEGLLLYFSAGSPTSHSTTVLATVQYTVLLPVLATVLLIGEDE